MNPPLHLKKKVLLRIGEKEREEEGDIVLHLKKTKQRNED